MKRRAVLTPALCICICIAALFAGAGSAGAQVTCTDQNTVTAHVVVLDQVIMLTRFGAQIPGGMIYALARDVFPTGTTPQQETEENSCRWQKCTHGHVQLRSTKRPRPIVLRVNERECLNIDFQNLLAETNEGNLQTSTRSASIHVMGMSWADGPQDDGSYVGKNPSSLVAPGNRTPYRLIADQEGSYFLSSMADSWSTMKTTLGKADGGTLSLGLFGVVNIQPSGTSAGQSWQAEWYRSQVTEQDLCLATPKKDKDHPEGHTWSDGRCTRPSANSLPVIDYQATYPDKHPRAGLPILNMRCNVPKLCDKNELIYSDLTAVITGPKAGRFPNKPTRQQPPALRPVYVSPDRLQPYREFTIIYHESFQVLQAFNSQYKGTPVVQAAADNFGINYGMGGLSTPLLSNRFGIGPAGECAACKYEEFFLSSWALGDPAMPVDSPVAGQCIAQGTCSDGTSCDPDKPNQCGGNACTFTEYKCDAAQNRPTAALYPDDPSNVYHSYMSDHVRFRISHAGADLHHLHHQHAHQWLGTPNSPNGDYLDSQSIGPGSSFTLEMVYNGSGNLNQTVGDSIFHCHFYPHFASGMWSLWRVHDVFERGTELCTPQQIQQKTCTVGQPAPNSRALPDAEIARGTPIPAVVPMPTLPMAPAPARVQLASFCSNDPSKACAADAECGSGNACQQSFCVVQTDAKTGGEGPCVAAIQASADPKSTWEEGKKYLNPGYPFFIPGIAGTRAPHPPMDFAYACRDSGAVCKPGDANACGAGDLCKPMDGGLPRHLIVRGGTAVFPQPLDQTDFSKELEEVQGLKLPEDGTLVEKIAMATHAQRFHDTQLPDGRQTGICNDNFAPCTPGTPGDRSQCQNPFAAKCDPDGSINFVLNGLPPTPGAPYADPCIRFERQGGPAGDLLTRSYLAADIQFDAIFNKSGWHFPQQRILSLWGDVQPTLDGTRAPEPLFMRVNSYDCVDYAYTNLVPNVYELDDFQVRTPTDIIGQHIHLVKFDVTSSDGSGNGWNYEDGTFAPNEVTERIDAINKDGGLYGPYTGGKLPPPVPLTAGYIKFFGPGQNNQWVGSQATLQRWYTDPLYNNYGICSTDLRKSCTLGEMQNGISTGKSPCPGNGVCVSSAGKCSDNGKACTDQDLRLCGSPKADCNPDFDRTLRSVFTHDHFGPSTHQQTGLYAGLMAEPKGSQWLNNQTGEVFGGYDPSTGENYPGRTVTQNGVTVSDGGPTSWQAVIQTPNLKQSYREYFFEVQDSALMFQPFSVSSEFDPRGCQDSDSSEPCGFCSYNGVCVETASGQVASPVTQCVVNPPGGAVTASCTSGTECRLHLDHLTRCTPANYQTTCYGQTQGVVSSCNFIPGIPSTSWAAAGTPIDAGQGAGPGGVEAITFNNATNNFSFNYRNEPLYARTTDPSTGNPMPGKHGDMAFAYSSALDRPNLTIGFCNPYSVPCRFCSDNGLACTPEDVSKCADPKTAICGPYPPLTPGVSRNDPFTPLLRAYAGDNVQVRPLIGAHINPHNFTIHDLNWLLEPSYVDSGWRNSEVMGISEHFELALQVQPKFKETFTASADSKPWTDYLYQPGLAAIEQASGNWGLLRAYDRIQKDLFQVPGSKPEGERIAVCPPDAKVRSYEVAALSVRNLLKGNQLVYNQILGFKDPEAIVLVDRKDPKLTCTPPGSFNCSYEGKPEPLVLRAAAGECINVTLQNGLPPATSGLCPDGTSCTYGDVCSDKKLCQLYGSCWNDASLSCTPAAASSCEAVTCSCTGTDCQKTCSNNDNVNCTTVADCPGPCNAVIGLGIGSGQVDTQVSVTSLNVGLRPQLVTFDARTSDGTNAGFNPEQTAAPQQSVQYTWYAGNVDAASGKHIPIEFGAANLLAADPMNHYLHGLFGGLIIEPKGASFKPATGTTSVVSFTDVHGRPRQFREFVIFAQDDTNDFSGNFNAVNYASEYLFGGNGPIRFCGPANTQAGCDSSDNSCVNTAAFFCNQTVGNQQQCVPVGKSCVDSSGNCVECDQQPPFPTTPTFLACAGEEVRFRLLHGGGTNTNNTFELFGHVFSEQPYMTRKEHCIPHLTHTNLYASQVQGMENLCGSKEFTLETLLTGGVWNDNLGEWKGSRPGHGPGNHYDIIVEAGGANAEPGDYMYRSFPAFHYNLGLWGIFRVLPRSDPGLKCIARAGGPSAVSAAEGGPGGEP